MTDNRNTMPGGMARHMGRNVPFQDTHEAKERREVRRTIRMAKCLSRNERDTLLYIVNLWFVHRRQEGSVHPGVEKIAAKVALSVRSIKTFLSRFRKLGLLKAVAFAKGGRKATRYTVDFMTMQEVLDPHGVEHRPGKLEEYRPTENPCNSGPSREETPPSENVKTVQNLHTVIDSVNPIVADNDDCASSSDTHPAFAPFDSLPPDLAKAGKPDFEPQTDQETPVLAWMMGAAA